MARKSPKAMQVAALGARVGASFSEPGLVTTFSLTLKDLSFNAKSVPVRVQPTRVEQSAGKTRNILFMVTLQPAKQAKFRSWGHRVKRGRSGKVADEAACCLCDQLA